MKAVHKPVLLTQVKKQIESLSERSRFVDATLGDGGHSLMFLENFTPEFLLSIDWDLQSIRFVLSSQLPKAKNLGYHVILAEYDPIAKRLIEDHKDSGAEGSGKRWYIVHSNFVYLDKILENLGVKNVDVVLFDLGVSSRQLEAKKRGFSFKDKGTLDMRMDPQTQQVKAYDLLNFLSQKELVRLFVETVKMPKSFASKLAEEIVALREERPFGDKDDIRRLNSIAYKIVPVRRGSRGRLHPATLVFLALRIAVNTELSNLSQALPIAFKVLNPGGLLIVIGFHSGEFDILDRFVADKNYKIIVPSLREVAANPRSRSAKMYVIYK